MSRLLLLLSIISYWSTFQLNAQSTSKGEIQALLERSEYDTAYINRSNKFANELYETNPDTAIQFIQSIIPKADSLSYLPGLVDLHISLGTFYGGQNEFKQAAEVQKKALQFAIQSGDRLKQIQILRHLGGSYTDLHGIRTGIGYFQQALDLAQKINDKDKQASILSDIGLNYGNLAVFDTAEQLLQRSLYLYKELNNLRGQSNVYGNLGNNAARAGDLEKAINYYDKARALMHEQGNKSGEALVNRMMGYTYRVMGQLPQSLEQYQLALDLLEGLKMDVAVCLEEMAEVSVAAEDLPQATVYLERAYELLLDEGGDPQDLLRRKAEIHLLKEEYEDALVNFLKYLEKNKTAKTLVSVAQIHLKAGICFEKLKQPEAALPHLQTALGQAEQENDFLVIAECLVNQGRVYQKIGDPVRAVSNLVRAIETAKETGNLEFQMEASELLYQIHKAKGDLYSAMNYQESYYRIRDSLIGEKNIKQITRLEEQYSFEKEKQQLQFDQAKELEQQKSIQRIILIALVGAAILALTLTWFYRSKQKANKELNKLNEELLEQKTVIEQQKEKLEELDEAKSRFFTNISHEFRTPLTIISGMADQVKDKPELWLDKGASMIKQNSVQLLNLVNQILDLRKLESNKLNVQMVQGDIVSYLRYIMDSYHSFARSQGIHLHFLSEQAQHHMDYDPEKLMRIISNLLSNALKYTPEGGHIYINLSQKNNALHLRVQDTGDGIPADRLPYIFDRFYQVDDSSTRKVEGTGVGLALTQQLVKLMRGEIEVTSEVGRGTTFLIKLPITRESKFQEMIQQSVIEENIQSMSAGAIGTEITDTVFSSTRTEKDIPTVLIVEDNQDVRQFLIACLEGDYQLQIANNGQEGIDTAIETIPDIIVSDVMMPEKDGFELCDTLKQDERTSHIPVILLTAKADLESKISGLERGADDYLTKPVEPKELLVRLNNLLKLRKQLQERYSSFDYTQAKKNPAPGMEDSFLMKVQKVVEENIVDADFGNVHLARKLNLSESQLYRKIKALTNKSPVPFIRSIRLHKAKELLQTTEMNVSEVAYEVGFTDPAYFSRAFSKEFKMAPNAIRK